MPLVKALQPGHYLTLREEGEVFEVPDDFTGTDAEGNPTPLPAWVKAVKAKPEPEEQEEA